MKRDREKAAENETLVVHRSHFPTAHDRRDVHERISEIRDIERFILLENIIQSTFFEKLYNLRALHV